MNKYPNLLEKSLSVTDVQNREGHTGHQRYLIILENLKIPVSHYIM